MVAISVSPNPSTHSSLIISKHKFTDAAFLLL
jgi:hypothetical protein